MIEHMICKLRVQRWCMLRNGNMSLRKYESIMWQAARAAKQLKKELPMLLRRQV